MELFLRKILYNFTKRPKSIYNSNQAIEQENSNCYYVREREESTNTQYCVPAVWVVKEERGWVTWGDTSVCGDSVGDIRELPGLLYRPSENRNTSVKVERGWVTWGDTSVCGDSVGDIRELPGLLYSPSENRNTSVKREDGSPEERLLSAATQWGTLGSCLGYYTVLLKTEIHQWRERMGHLRGGFCLRQLSGGH